MQFPAIPKLHKLHHIDTTVKAVFLEKKDKIDYIWKYKHYDIRIFGWEVKKKVDTN